MIKQPERRQLPIEVHVIEEVIYTFPNPEARCSAHGQSLCVNCARNPGNCVSEMGGCSVYSDDGMHWDTCPNRIR